MASYRETPYGIEVTVYKGRDKKGKNVREYKTFKTKKEAERWAAEQLISNDRMVSLDDSRMKLKDFMNKWYKDVASKKSINTAYNSKSRMDHHIIPDIGQYPLNKLTPLLIQDFYNGLDDKGLAASSKKKIMETLSNALRYALKLRLIPYLPTDIEKESVTRGKVIYWTVEEFSLFLDYVKDISLYIPVYIMGMTGIRPAELMALQWKKIDLDNRLMEITSQIIQDKESKKLVFTDILKTDSSFRTITIPKSLIEDLRSYKATTKHNRPNNFVVPTREGSMSSPSTLRTMFNKYLNKLRKEQEKDLIKEGFSSDEVEDMIITKMPLYNLRHTHATMLLNNNENIKVISERLGHRSIKTTMDIYAQVMPRSKSKTADLLDELMKKD